MKVFDFLKNSKGQIFYGMHFYPGVAQYDTDQGSYRVFVNEATIRKLNPTFAGRPVYVEHVDGVDENLDVVRNEADGWVVESFFNEADGKTWVKFILVSDRAFAAVQKGYRLSNAYLPELADAHDKTWNGVDYQKTVLGGEFEHLAIVQNPRYEESVIMSPDEFKAYNTNLKADLVRFANSKDKKGENKVKFFKREKLANAIDIENTMVELPKSKKEMSLANAIEVADKFLNMNGYANGDHMVKVNDKDEMSVNDLVKAYQAKCNAEMEEGEDDMENADDEDGGEPGGDVEDDIDPERAENEEIAMGGDGERDDNGDESLDNVEDEDKGSKRDMGSKNPLKKSESQKNKKMKNALAAKKLANAREKAKRLRNAHLNGRDEMEYARVDMAEDQIARGKSRYGSGK